MTKRIRVISNVPRKLFFSVFVYIVYLLKNWRLKSEIFVLPLSRLIFRENECQREEDEPPLNVNLQSRINSDWKQNIQDDLDLRIL